MVYGKYDSAYILPNCDLCGDELHSYEVDLEIEIETVTETGSDIHQGHLCEECNEYEPKFDGAAPEEVKFRFRADNPAYLTKIEAFKGESSNNCRVSIREYEPSQTPDFLRCFGYGIVKRNQSVDNVKYDCERVQDISDSFYEVVKENIYGIGSSD